MTFSFCNACQQPIEDQWIYEVLGSLWHGHCLRCSDCHQSLTEKCFSRNGQLFCHKDFLRRFYSQQCSTCFQTIDQGDFYIQLSSEFYHWNCAKCSLCSRQIFQGEKVYFIDRRRFVCENDFHRSSQLESFEDKENSSFHSQRSTTSESLKDNQLDLIMSDHSMDCRDQPSTSSSSSPVAMAQAPAFDSRQIINSSPKKRGPRTTIKTKQLEQLKLAFASTPKPNRHIREQLARATGLAMRVIQVWFQNRRSKERRIKQSMHSNSSRRHQFNSNYNFHSTEFNETSSMLIQQRFPYGSMSDADLTFSSGSQTSLMNFDGRPTTSSYIDRHSFANHL